MERFVLLDTIQLEVALHTVLDVDESIHNDHKRTYRQTFLFTADSRLTLIGQFLRRTSERSSKIPSNHNKCFFGTRIPHSIRDTVHELSNTEQAL